jgi:hypothetical protein
LPYPCHFGTIGTFRGTFQGGISPSLGTFNLTFTVRLGDDLSTNGTKLDRERGETTLSQEGSKFLNNPKDLGQAQKAVDAVSKLIDAA